MPRNYKDYDALTAERDDFVRRVGGQDIEFPKILPAKKMLDIRRNARKEQLTDEQIEDMGFDLIETVIGRERWDFVAESLSSEQLGELAEDLMLYYGITETAEEAEEGKGGGETETPSPSPSSASSEIGEPSTQTSSGSTPTQDAPSTQEPSTGSPSQADSDNSPLALIS